MPEVYSLHHTCEVASCVPVQTCGGDMGIVAAVHSC